MTEQRYKELIKNVESRLTVDELKEGWHFCPEWDGMLIHPNDIESDACLCFKEILQ